MTVVTLEEIQKDLPAFLERVQAGETLLIMQADRPMAEIRPVSPSSRLPRPFGLCVGEFSIPDDFDENLPEEFQQPDEKQIKAALKLKGTLSDEEAEEMRRTVEELRISWR